MQGVSYFECDDNFGIFVPISAVETAEQWNSRKKEKKEKKVGFDRIITCKLASFFCNHLELITPTATTKHNTHRLNAHNIPIYIWHEACWRQINCYREVFHSFDCLISMENLVCKFGVEKGLIVSYHIDFILNYNRKVV